MPRRTAAACAADMATIPRFACGAAGRDPFRYAWCLTHIVILTRRCISSPLSLSLSLLFSLSQVLVLHPRARHRRHHDPQRRLHAHNRARPRRARRVAAGLVRRRVSYVVRRPSFVARGCRRRRAPHPNILPSDSAVLIVISSRRHRHLLASSPPSHPLSQYFVVASPTSRGTRSSSQLPPPQTPRFIIIITNNRRPDRTAPSSHLPS